MFFSTLECARCTNERTQPTRISQKTKSSAVQLSQWEREKEKELDENENKKAKHRIMRMRKRAKFQYSWWSTTNCFAPPPPLYITCMCLCANICEPNGNFVNKRKTYSRMKNEFLHSFANGATNGWTEKEREREIEYITNSASCFRQWNKSGRPEGLEHKREGERWEKQNWRNVCVRYTAHQTQYPTNTATSTSLLWRFLRLVLWTT